MGKNICLVGSAPSSAGLAPFASTDWEIWACSPGCLGIAKTPQAWFELHRYEPGQQWFGEAYCKFLEDANFPVYVSEPTPRIKNAVVLPIDGLVKKYSPYWFNSSLSWMFAMAIEQKPDKIALFGVDMAANEEYHSQKMGCIWFAQYARSLGIEVGVPPESDLFTPPPLYGVCETSHQWIKSTARQRELQHRLNEAEALQKHKEQEIHFLKGAIDDLQWSQQTWGGNMAARVNFVEPTPTSLPKTPPQILDSAINKKPIAYVPQKKGNGRVSASK